MARSPIRVDFSTIVREIETEEYKSDAIKPQSLENSQQPLLQGHLLPRQQRAAMLKRAQVVSQNYVKKGFFSKKQGAAIEELIRIKKDQLANAKYRTDTKYLQRHRPIADDMIEMERMHERTPFRRWADIAETMAKPKKTQETQETQETHEHIPELRNADILKKTVRLNARYFCELNHNEARDVLRGQSPGSFLLHGTEWPDRKCVSWLDPVHGGFNYCAFDADTGALETKDGSRKSIFSLISELNQARAPRSFNTEFVTELSASEAAKVLQGQPPGTYLLSASRNPGFERLSFVDAAGIVRHTRFDPKDEGQKRSASRLMVRLNTTRQEHLSSLQQHRFGTVDQSGRTVAHQKPYFTEAEARKKIKEAPANSAIPYRKEDGTHWIFIKGSIEGLDKDARTFTLGYLPEKEQVKLLNEEIEELRPYASRMFDIQTLNILTP